MPAVSLYGVTLAWSVAGGCRDPLAELLSGFDPPAPTGSGLPPTVNIALRRAGEGASEDPRRAGWEPSFFHGAVETFRGPGGFLIWDRASRVLVPTGGGTIEGEIAPIEREGTPGSASTALQLALILALRVHGLFHLHAAALVLPSGVPVLVVGGSGAGKTTTTLALLEGGADYLCDDSLYLTTRAGGVSAVAFPREFHVGRTTLAAFPRLGRFAGTSPTHSEKRPLDPRGAYPGRFRRVVELGAPKAVAIFPVIIPAEATSLVPIARAEAFGKLLSSSGAIIVDGMSGREENLDALKALLHAVLCHELRLGADGRTAPVLAIASRISAAATKLEAQ